MAEVHSFSFDLETLHSLEGIPEHVTDMTLSGVHGLGFNLSVFPKLETAGLAFGNVVVGVVVGKFQRGGAGSIVLAFKGNTDPVA